jgi:hypothetical protein
VFLHVIQRNSEVSEVPYILLASYLVYFLNMKMETTFACETSDIFRTTRRYNPEDSNFIITAVRTSNQIRLTASQHTSLTFKEN